MSVIREIADAVGECDKPVYLIADREDAIKQAVSLADEGDFVLLAGKGHETYQLVCGERIPLSEKEILEHFDRLNLLDEDIESDKLPEPVI